MKFVLEPSVFTEAVSASTLGMFVHYALIRRHRVEIENRDDPLFTTWLAGRPLVDREEWDLVLEQSEILETREPSTLIVKVSGNGVTNWETAPPVITLAEGTQLLTTPLKVLVENSINDRAFLLCFASVEQRNVIQNAEDSGWLKFEHGGGITSIYTTLENRTNPLERLTTWVVVDSDALMPDIPSEQSERVCGLCKSLGVKFYQLRRRAIENYLPPSAIQAWALERRSQRWPAFEAFMALTSQQRHHFNMKSGLLGDADRAEPHKLTLYQTLSDQRRTALRNGFGQTANRFESRPFSEEHLRRDESWSEMNPQMTSLIAALR